MVQCEEECSISWSCFSVFDVSVSSVLEVCSHSPTESSGVGWGRGALLFGLCQHRHLPWKGRRGRWIQECEFSPFMILSGKFFWWRVRMGCRLWGGMERGHLTNTAGWNWFSNLASLQLPSLFPRQSSLERGLGSHACWGGWGGIQKVGRAWEDLEANWMVGPLWFSL